MQYFFFKCNSMILGSGDLCLYDPPSSRDVPNVNLGIHCELVSLSFPC